MRTDGSNKHYFIATNLSFSAVNRAHKFEIIFIFTILGTRVKKVVRIENILSFFKKSQKYFRLSDIFSGKYRTGLHWLLNIPCTRLVQLNIK